MNACEPASGTTGGLRLGRKDGLFTLETRWFLPRPLEIVFPFFADAGNLETITPPWLRFEILTPRPIAMRAGALIEYRLRLHGIPVRWQSDKNRRGGGTVTSIPLGYRTPLSMIAPVWGLQSPKNRGEVAEAGEKGIHICKVLARKT